MSRPALQSHLALISHRENEGIEFKNVDDSYSTYDIGLSH